MEEICSMIEAVARAGSANQSLPGLIEELEAAFERVQSDLAGGFERLLPPVDFGVPKISAQADVAAVPRAATNRVLVAEDDPLIARFLTGSMSGAGFEVTHATDGESALRAIDETDFGCVVLDINMPKLDGFAVLSEMRLKPRTKRTPVLILSLRSQEDDIVRGFDLGADDYVTKPFSPLEVISRVKRLMRH